MQIVIKNKQADVNIQCLTKSCQQVLFNEFVLNLARCNYLSLDQMVLQ